MDDYNRLIFAHSPLTNHLKSCIKKISVQRSLEVVQITLGRPLAAIIAFSILCFTLINTATESRSYITQFISINFPNAPLLIMYLLFLAICMWGAKKGWESIGSVAWAVFPYITIALGILFFLLFKEASFYRIFPLFGTGKWEIAKASFNYVSLFSEAFTIALMYPFVKSHKAYVRGLYSSLILTVFIMAWMYISYLCVFDFRSVEKITYPFNEAIRFVSLGRGIANIETILFAFWLLAVFVKFIFYIYVISRIFGFLFRIQEFEHTIMPITLLILIMGMIPENNEVNMLVIRKYSLIYNKYLLLFLPPLLWIASKIKEGRPG